MKDNRGSEASILVVDDDLDLLEVLKDELATAFDKITAVARPTAAIDLLKRNSYDCIISDFRMPEMNGIQFISHLNRHYPQIPVILLTGNGSDPEVIRAIENGAFDYMDKPFKTPILINRVRNALLLPQLEQLIIDMAEAEFPQFNLGSLVAKPPEERLKIIRGLQALVQTRLLSRRRRKAS